MAESRKAAAAHRAAVNTQATLESFRKGGSPLPSSFELVDMWMSVLKAPAINNVRTALTPGVMKELAQMEGWSNPNPKDKVAGGQAVEGFFAPRPEVPEAKWEVGMVCSQKFDQDVKRVCMALPSPLSPEEAYYQSASLPNAIHLLT